LIKKFIDPDAEFLFVPANEVMVVAERERAVRLLNCGVCCAMVDGWYSRRGTPIHSRRVDRLKLMIIVRC
jgi:hypothetical protein